MPGTGLSEPWLAILTNCPAQVAGSQRTKNMPGTGLSEPWLAIHSNCPAQAAGS